MTLLPDDPLTFDSDRFHPPARAAPVPLLPRALPPAHPSDDSGCFAYEGARGISLLFASGDSGANCKNNALRPNWPAASPYVTAVGGTTGAPQEEAVGLSSGGFSNRYLRPAWQQHAVASYLSNSSRSLPTAAFKP